MWSDATMPKTAAVVTETQAEPATGAAFFMKQMGNRPVGIAGATGKGEDPAEWPRDLRVRGFPVGLPGAEQLVSELHRRRSGISGYRQGILASRCPLRMTGRPQ
jgi:hypothetical protein